MEQWNANRTNIKEDSDSDDDRESLVDTGEFQDGWVTREQAKGFWSIVPGG